MIDNVLIEFMREQLAITSVTMRLYNYTGQAIELKKLQDKQDDLLQESYSRCKYWKGLADTIKLRCKHMDTSSFIGWKVKHTYCCKTIEGVIDTAVNYYIIDSRKTLCFASIRLTQTAIWFSLHTDIRPHALGQQLPI